MSRSNTGSFEYLDLKSLSVITLEYGSPLNAKVKLHKDTRAMSTTAKVTLGASITFAVGIITYVHYWQKKEREVFFTLWRGGGLFSDGEFTLVNLYHLQ